MDLNDILAAPNDEEFQRELREVVALQLPRLFALCEEIGEREDGYVRYWGLDFGEGAELVSAEGGRSRARFRSVESACAFLSRRAKTHLIWADTVPSLDESPR